VDDPKEGGLVAPLFPTAPEDQSADPAPFMDPLYCTDLVYRAFADDLIMDPFAKTEDEPRPGR
jgi:hypothetical protein